MEVALQTQWGALVALYLFLGGLAAGTLCVCAVIHLKTKDKYKSTIRFGAWTGTILLVIGVLCLVAETSMPFRAMMVWQSFVNPQSWMTIGAWLLVLGVIVFGLFALSLTDWVTDRLKFLKRVPFALAVIAVPVSIGIAIYTGVLLGVLISRPLWNTWLLPALFTVSALDTGVALVLGYLALRRAKAKAVTAERAAGGLVQGGGQKVNPAHSEQTSETRLQEARPEGSPAKKDAAGGSPPQDGSMQESPPQKKQAQAASAPGSLANTEQSQKVPVQGSAAQGVPAADDSATLRLTLEKSTIILIVLEIIVLLAFLLAVASSGRAGEASVQLLTTGQLGMYFWILLVACGLLVPLAISVFLVVRRGLAERVQKAISVLCIVLCLVGGCTLRFLVLLAGLPVYL